MNIELMLVLVALLSVALCSISSDIISCPANVTTVSNFRTSLFAGTWFTQKMIPLPDDDPPARCLSQILIPLSIWQMEASFRLIDDMDDFQERTGTLIVEPKSRTILLYPGDRFRHAYDIIATDYNKFAITYSCRRLDSYLTIGKRLQKLSCYFHRTFHQRAGR